MSFFVKNQYRPRVAVELFARDQVWPGDDQVYLLEKGKERSRCRSHAQAGETICYGAWIAGDDRTSWGVGADNDSPATNAASSDAAARTIELGP